VCRSATLQLLSATVLRRDALGPQCYGSWICAAGLSHSKQGPGHHHRKSRPGPPERFLLPSGYLSLSAHKAGLLPRSGEGVLLLLQDMNECPLHGSFLGPPPSWCSATWPSSTCSPPPPLPLHMPSVANLACPSAAQALSAALWGKPAAPSAQKVTFASLVRLSPQKMGLRAVAQDGLHPSFFLARAELGPNLSMPLHEVGFCKEPDSQVVSRTLRYFHALSRQIFNFRSARRFDFGYSPQIQTRPADRLGPDPRGRSNWEPQPGTPLEFSP